ncbi:MAG: hypothetical protein QGD93_11170, partial [Actinomycetota bacterium]|nr:hypothetical protein [Actinomycetota bacterium]
KAKHKKVSELVEVLQLVDKRGNLVELFPTTPKVSARGIVRCQKRLLKVMQAQKDHGCPIRIIILKARQLGMSTFIGLLFYAMVHEHPNRRAVVCAQDQDATKGLYRRVKRAHEEIEDTRPMENLSGTELCWKLPHSSDYRVMTAGKKDLGRSDTINYLHMSEVGFWPNQSRSLLAAMQTVPDQPDTAIVIESTANGQGDEFHKRWGNSTPLALAEETGIWDGFIGVFFSWLENPEEYTLSIPEHFDWGAVPNEIKEGEARLREMSAELGWNEDTIDRQMYWRRRKIIDACGGSVDSFRQEYPSTPEEAFLLSGRRAIPAQITEHHRESLRPYRLAKLVWDEWTDDGVAMVYAPTDADELARVSEGDYNWHVWEPPHKKHDYAIGGDVAEYKVSDPSDEMSDPDKSCIAVLNRVTMTPAAQWHGRIMPDDLGRELLKAALFYNRGWATPEANAVGQATLIPMLKHEYSICGSRHRGYNRLYQRKRAPDKIRESDSQLYGFKTTSLTRPLLLFSWIAYSSWDLERRWDGKFVCVSEELVDEEEKFVFDKMGKPVHKINCHDDVLFAWMIAMMLHDSQPRTFSSPERGGPSIRPAIYDGGRDVDGMRMLDGTYIGKARVMEVTS